MYKFKTIDKKSEGNFTDKGSKFPTYAFEVYNEEDIKNYLNEVKTIHPKATHHCYAYQLGLDKNNYRANDDGEPTGSAGRPILGQIYSNQLTNILIIVVRYYGGTKLGVSGLINAYKKSAQNAIENATIVEKEQQVKLIVKSDYLQINDLLNFLKKNKINKPQQIFDAECTIIFTVPKSLKKSISLWLNNKSFTFTEEETL